MSHELFLPTAPPLPKRKERQVDRQNIPPLTTARPRFLPYRVGSIDVESSRCVAMLLQLALEFPGARQQRGGGFAADTYASGSALNVTFLRRSKQTELVRAFCPPVLTCARIYVCVCWGEGYVYESVFVLDAPCTSYHQNYFLSNTFSFQAHL